MLKNFHYLNSWKRSLIIFPLLAAVFFLILYLLFAIDLLYAIIGSISTSIVIVLYNEFISEHFTMSALSWWKKTILKYLILFSLLLGLSYMFLFDFGISEAAGWSLLIVFIFITLLMDRKLLKEYFGVPWWKRALVVLPVFAIIYSLFLVLLLNAAFSRALSFSLIAGFFIVVFSLVREQLGVYYKNATGRDLFK